MSLISLINIGMNLVSILHFQTFTSLLAVFNFVESLSKLLKLNTYYDL